MRLRSTLLAIPLFMSACSTLQSEDGASITAEDWGVTKGGEKVELFTLKNSQGMEARITNYGGIVVSLTAPDEKGVYEDVVLGKDSFAEYEAGHPFFGAIAGRYANRIGGASFEIDGQRYNVTPNSGTNHIHGGKVGFDKKVWKAAKVTKGGAVGLKLKLVSADGEEGYPGTLSCEVTYWLTNKNALEIDYLATTDKATVINLTNHSYFNLAGQDGGDVLGHEVEIFADQFTPTNDKMIPTGALEPVAGTPMDFTSAHRIGERIGADYEALRFGKGYDHNYVLRGSGLRKAARVRDPKSGRVMEVLTREPGVQFYTGNHLRGTMKGGKPCLPRHGFCLETQHYPDSPNRPAFPSTVLRPGDTYQTTTIFQFSAE
jgi:aldose 1-epimerase